MTSSFIDHELQQSEKARSWLTGLLSIVCTTGKASILRRGTTGCPVRSYSLMPFGSISHEHARHDLKCFAVYLSPVSIQIQQSCNLYSADSAPASLGNNASLSDWAFSKASLKRLASGCSHFSKATVSRVGRMVTYSRCLQIE